MDIVVILQIITVAISVLSVVINVIITKSESRQEHYIQITTEQRREIYNSNKKATAEVISVCLPACIMEIKKNGKPYKTELSSRATTLMCSFKQVYKEENDIILALSELCNSAFKYYDTPSDDTKECLLAKLSTFYKLASAYDLADWKFLKRQSVGKEMGSDEFDEILAQTMRTYNDIDTLSVFKNL